VLAQVPRGQPQGLFGGAPLVGSIDVRHPGSDQSSLGGSAVATRKAYRVSTCALAPTAGLRNLSVMTIVLVLCVTPGKDRNREARQDLGRTGRQGCRGHKANLLVLNKVLRGSPHLSCVENGHALDVGKLREGKIRCLMQRIAHP
jgi:hypothetical protein